MIKIILNDDTPVFKTLTQVLLKSPEDTKIYISDNAFILCEEDKLKNTIRFINNMDRINAFCIGPSYDYFVAQIMCLDDEIAPDQPGAFGYVADLNRFIRVFMYANYTVPKIVITDFNIIEALKCQSSVDCPGTVTFTVHSINI